MPPLLTIQNLTAKFGDKTVVDGICFDLEAGKTTALVGESGSGKSVATLSLVKLSTAQVSGQAIFNGQNLLEQSECQLQQIRGADISFVFQEPMTALNPLHKVAKQLREAIELHDVYQKQIQERCVALLQKTGLEDTGRILNAYPHQLSGGQRQRVMIAMALANEPALLIADEPTTALDVTTEQKILDMLAERQREHKMALLLITHNLQVARRVADEVLVMQQGKIVECGLMQQVFENPQHDYTKTLLASVPQGRAKPVADASTSLFQAEQLSVKFSTEKNVWGKTTKELVAVNDVDFTIQQGETLGVVGESGSGKSTLAFAVLRLQDSTGNLLFDGTDLRKISAKQLREKRQDFQIVFQDPFGSLSPRLTVADIIAEGLPKMPRAQRQERVAAALKEVELPIDAANRYPHEFSGGQRQRIAIARALAVQPKLIVLDEPTSALDAATQVQVLNLLRRLQEEKGFSYLFISHDLRVVRALAHRVLVMQRGIVVEAGDTEQLFEKPGHDYTKLLLAAA